MNELFKINAIIMCLIILKNGDKMIIHNTINSIDFFSKFFFLIQISEIKYVTFSPIKEINTTFSIMNFISLIQIPIILRFFYIKKNHKRINIKAYFIIII